MRHQYQRRMSTSPVPAPSASSSRHASPTDVICHVTTSDIANKKTVVRRDTFT